MSMKALAELIDDPMLTMEEAELLAALHEPQQDSFPPRAARQIKIRAPSQGHQNARPISAGIDPAL